MAGFPGRLAFANQKNFFIFFKKSIDILPPMCYNTIVPREGRHELGTVEV